jgi:hypothetical protein
MKDDPPAGEPWCRLDLAKEDKPSASITWLAVAPESWHADASSPMVVCGCRDQDSVARRRMATLMTRLTVSRLSMV